MENYFWNTEDVQKDKKIYMLVIYDIGYGFRVQKSAFEAMITEKLYGELIDCIPKLIDKTTDSVRIYKIRGQAEVSLFGIGPIIEDEEIVII